MDTPSRFRQVAPLTTCYWSRSTHDEFTSCGMPVRLLLVGQFTADPLDVDCLACLSSSEVSDQLDKLEAA
jgi:hypothetical protein